MLLDRKKIRRWAKWIALALAVVFAVSFVGIGIGQGTGNLNVLELFSGGCTEGETADTVVVDEDLESALAKLEADPTSTEAMLELGQVYEGRYRASDNVGYENAQQAADYYEQAIAVDPSLKEVYLTLGKLYDQMNSYEDAARVLNLATSIDPENPQIFYYLGKVQQALGNTGEVILAWERYLELAPADDIKISLVRTRLQEMTAPTTTTVESATTTTEASTTTTVD